MGFSKIRTPKSTHPRSRFWQSIFVFSGKLLGNSNFSISDSGKLLGEFERTRSFLPTNYWGYPI